MSDSLTDTQRRVLERVESEPAAADIDDIETLVEVACRSPDAEGTDAASAVSDVALEQPALVAEGIDSVLPLFAVDDTNIRCRVASVVATLAESEPARLADTTAVTNVQQAITDREGWNRVHAAEMLSEIAISSPELIDDEILPMLARRLETEEFPDARAQIATTVGHLAKAKPELLDGRIEAAIEEQLGENDEIVESVLQSAADAVAEAKASAAGTGSEGETTVFCPACGTELTTDPTLNFCRNCGQEL